MKVKSPKFGFEGCHSQRLCDSPYLKIKSAPFPDSILLGHCRHYSGVMHLLVLEPLLGLLEGVVRLAENGLAVLGDRLVDRGDRLVSLFRSVLRQLGEVIY